MLKIIFIYQAIFGAQQIYCTQNNYNELKICNASIYSCLCGSLQESVQEGKGEIIYHFRQHGCYACQSLGNLVTIVFFQSC